MSASLVGSEMCIRDRVSTCGRSGELWRAPEGPPQPRRGSARAQSTRETVSYTHLTLPTICSV
eukprot:13555759-Alexandrium_andersonii.AAC.1